MPVEYPGIEHVNNGEAVSGPVASRPTSQLERRTERLQQMIDDGLFGSTHYVYDAPLSTDTVVGTPVCLAGGVYQPALFGMSIVENEYTPINSSWVVGMVQSKSTTSSGDVATMGVVRLRTAQLQAVLQAGQTPRVGPIFLSTTTAGRLTYSRPPVGFHVAFCDGPDANDFWTLLLMPVGRNPLENHIHYRIPLTSGAADLIDELPGWLTVAGNASFFTDRQITVPVGALRYYVHQFDDYLSTIWPPQPIGAAELERNGIRIRTEGDDATALINEYGIWWMDATTVPPTTGTVTAVGTQFYAGGYPDRIDLLFARQFGKTGAVTSLTAKNTSIRVTNPRGADATTGALELAMNFELSEGANIPGHLPIKGIDNETLQILRGIVVEGIQSSDGSITITNGVAVNEEDGDPASGFEGGRINIAVTNPNQRFEGGFTSLMIDNVEVIDISGILAYAFRNGVAGSLRGVLRLPIVGVPVLGLRLRIEATVLARTNGNMPAFTITTRRLPRAAAVNTPLTAAAVDSAFDTLPFGAVAVTTNQYVHDRTDFVMTVFGGDIIYVNLSRGSADGFAGDLALLDLRWLLEPA